MKHTFTVVFPDSKIASSFSMARTKTMYVINRGLATYIKSLLLDSLKISDIYVYLFDESLNDITQSCEMDLYIRYWNVIDNQVSVKY